MRKVLGMIAAVAASVALSGDARAMVITDTGAHNLNGVLGNLVIDINNATQVIDITADVLKAGTAAKLNFNISSSALESVPYLVRLTLTNKITPFNTGLGFAMNGFDFWHDNNAGFPFVGLGLPRSSDTFGFSSPGTIPNGYRFGGFNGGGGESYFNGVSVSTIRLGTGNDGNANSTTFSLNFVANPEPATLLLGSLITIPGGLALRRRRKAAAEVAAA